ncbi:MAG TPA: FadR/GntR family transcriptional regulator [Cellvibrionaceae bacterium]|nr:FadR/GntR family transcriptional regulator [Cellvibrionaceae bacterium]HMW70250.1 FadR/GntR family transcriptional regulator [Cellvibrionaceae bacterium]HNG60795.1 FadR/GntR family transcriptional regulator [Cellvibrionaceae bacterium]
MNSPEVAGNLVQQVTQSIGCAIVQGTFAKANAMITEAELSDRFKISRTVIREAVKMLAAKGLLTSRQRRGIRIAPSSQWNMFDEDVLQWTLSGAPSLHLLREFAQLRLAIEPEAAALASQCQDKAKIRDIQAAAEALMSVEQQGLSEYDADLHFHTMIFAATENRFFVQFRSFIQAALRVSIQCNFGIEGNKTAVADPHMQVYLAIEAGNAEMSRQLMREMLVENLRLIDLAIAQQNTVAAVGA